jgi:NADPH-dependent glutamate synthase beta subunit-like oxidoreductase/ferredoxin
MIMSTFKCPVNDSLSLITQALQDNWLQHPRSRCLAEEIQALISDIAMGRAGDQHIASLHQRVEALLNLRADRVGVETAKSLAETLDNHLETFESHITTRNCAIGECDFLTPAPCQLACPAGIDVPTYVSLIGMGQDAEAIDVIRKDNPFPWVCGLVCTRPCEFMCVRGRMDTPISIKSLKAFAAERALSQGRYQNPPQAPPNAKKICVIGAGPGGLSAAYYLALKGYSVRVLEALPFAGGMLMVGIPRYRLPREVIDREVNMIQDLGVTFDFNTRFGQAVTFQQLKDEGYEAFFFAIGAHASHKLGISGEDDYPQVHEAVDFLLNVALGERLPPGQHVVVVGGGNVAIDAARTCLRLGCRQVTLAYRRTHAEMPADAEEVEQAEGEGVNFAFLTIPLSIKGDGDRMTALRCIRAEMVAKPGSDRKSPKPIEGSEFDMPADAIISAIGQRVEYRWLSELKDLYWTRRDTIRVNSATMETNIPGIFAAGDAVTGPATVVEAIGGGKRAAQAIDRYLSGIPQPKIPPVPVRRQRVPYTEVPASTKMILKRPEMPLLKIDRRRTTFQQVELGLSENMVREESRRCLRCDICRRCGLCVQICRDRMGIDALEMGYLSFDHPLPSDFRRTQERCIACGACAANCPTGAMRIEDRGHERILSLCGTILNRQPLIYCENCGATMGPERYLDYVHKRVRPRVPVSQHRHLCDACARKRGIHGGVRVLPLE